MFTEEQIKIAAETDLIEFLSKKEMLSFKSYCSDYSRCNQHGSLIIKGRSNYYWNSRSESGNAINFLQNYYNLDFKEAVLKLLEYNNIPYNPPHTKYWFKDTSTERVFTVSTENIERAYGYLCKRRGIKKNIIDGLIESNHLIMVKEKDNHPNIGFRIFGPNGKESGYELHGTLDKKKFKSCISDSEGKNYGFNIKIGEPHKAFFFESAIDLLSFYQLKRDNKKLELKDVILVSLSGIKDIIIKEMKEDFNIQEIVICVDNDPTGDRFKNRVENKGIKFDTIDVPGGFKDWNEYLLSLINVK